MSSILVVYLITVYIIFVNQSETSPFYFNHIAPLWLAVIWSGPIKRDKELFNASCKFSKEEEEAEYDLSKL